VTQHLTIEELKKAAGNLRRIEDYLAVRAEWQLEQEGFEALRSADRAAMMIMEVLEPLVEFHPVNIDQDKLQLPAQMPAADLENSRLAKLAEYMDRLRAWFERRVGYVVAPKAGDNLETVYRSLLMIRKATESVLAKSHFEVTEPEQPAPVPIEAPVAGHSPVVEGSPVEGVVDQIGVLSAPMAMPAPRTMVSQLRRLILDNTLEDPLLEISQAEPVLTPAAKQLVAEFLEESGVNFAEHQLHRFQAEVRRRIERTPDGQVLVVKIGGIDGVPSPFFTYQPRATTLPH
jgi:hypothetical protein